MEIPIKLHAFLLIFLVFEPIAPLGIANPFCGGAFLELNTFGLFVLFFRSKK